MDFTTEGLLNACDFYEQDLNNRVLTILKTNKEHVNSCLVNTNLS